MEKTLLQVSTSKQTAEEITFRILLNGLLRELGNGKFYEGVPTYDLLTARALQKSKYPLHIKFECEKSELQVFAPVSYRSESALHEYGFPIWAVDHNNEKVFELEMDQLIVLIYKEFSDRFNEEGFDRFIERIHSSTKNMELTMAAYSENDDPLTYSFIESEQELPVGHNMHPFTKSRMGFSKAEQINFGPEFKKGMQLEYFLVNKDHVEAYAVFQESAKKVLQDMVSLPEDFENTWLKDDEQLSDFYLIPCHPWEAQHFLSTKVCSEMTRYRTLIYVGALGEKFYSTSSIRTMYSENSNWMLKFSMHVLLTGSVRINSEKDLKRGYASSIWWNHVRVPFEKEFEQFKLLLEPATVSVYFNGETIDSLNLLIRENPFQPKDKVLLLARLCQDEPGDESFIQRFFTDVSEKRGTGLEKAVTSWFEKYISLLLSPLNHLFSRYGMAPEVHQQNLLIALDDQLMPETIFVRDGQGYLIRESAKEQYQILLQNYPEIGTLFIRDERLLDIISHHLLVSNLSALIASLGKTGWVSERKLINILYKEFEKIHQKHPSELTKYAVENRSWGTKSNLKSAVLDMDGGANAAALSYAKVPNLLHKYFYSDQLIQPKGNDVFFSRYFAKEDVTITIRPVNMDTDLEMLHEWFNREHAIKIWQMNWPIDVLEDYYRTMLPGNEAHSYIILSNGEPSCNIEVYWASRDIVGDYYEVLPTDYGTHQFIAPIDPKKKYVSPSTQSMVDYVFAQPEVGKMVGEGSVDSLASMMNKAHVGFKIEKVIEMPHKKANLNFCYREWYWEKFPQNRNIETSIKTPSNEQGTGI